MDYRIVQYRDGKHWRIQYFYIPPAWLAWLLSAKWKCVTEELCGYDCHDAILEFNSYEAACRKVDDLRYQDKQKQDWTEIGEGSCR